MLIYRPWQTTTVAQANSNVFFPRIHGQKSKIKVSADSNMSLESATESISCWSPGQQSLTSLGLETHCSNVCIYLQIILFVHFYLFYSVLQGHLSLHLSFIRMMSLQDPYLMTSVIILFWSKITINVIEGCKFVAQLNLPQ